MLVSVLFFAVLYVYGPLIIKGDTLYALLGYCPDPFSSEGAVITIDSDSGNYKIIGRFNWPNQIFGCLFNYDPTITTKNHTIFLDFTSDFGFFITVDLDKAKVMDTITPKDAFFLGYINMEYNETSTNDFNVVGLTPNVEKNGLCSDGCFQFGLLNQNGLYKGLHDVYFKAMMDNAHYWDKESNVYYVQGSYDLNYSHPCAPRQSDLCMISIDVNNGNTLNKIGPNNYTIYQYYYNVSNINNNIQDVLVFVEGFDNICKHPYNNFGFAKINLVTTDIQLLTCIDRNITIEFTEYTAFNNDGTLFAEAVGNTETTTQVLIIDVNTGMSVVNTDLPGLGRKLPAWLDLYVIWGITF